MVVVKVVVVVAAVMVRQEATKAWDSDSNRPVDLGHGHLFIKLPWRAVLGNTHPYTHKQPRRGPHRTRVCFARQTGRATPSSPE